MQQQIPLPLGLQEDFNFDSFIADDNALIVDALKNSSEPFIFLWGDAGTGKTQLLQATCQYQTQLGKTAAYLPLKELQKFSPQILDGMGNIDLVCLEDIELVYGEAEWEEALFNLFNQLRQAEGRLVISSNASPQQSQAQLNDLKSRLCSGLPLNLKPLSDVGTIKALQAHALKLGLELTQDNAKYLISHYPRDLPSLWSQLEQLNQASLVAQRKLSIPFIKNTLKKD
ncbi:MAG: DnaA regulatory inactivator Hda [Cycloclasticus sp.]|nr:DnaA regulatory inactivator Hda [Cycloclasticus sp. 46_83_sub15_T18]OUR83567.1 DnaA regulatory inactivator Hda [Cycloclasticus sp. 46_120_T64]